MATYKAGFLFNQEANRGFDMNDLINQSDRKQYKVSLNKEFRLELSKAKHALEELEQVNYFPMIRHHYREIKEINEILQRFLELSR